MLVLLLSRDNNETNAGAMKMKGYEIYRQAAGKGVVTQIIV